MVFFSVKIFSFPKYSVRIETLEKEWKSNSSKHLINAGAKSSQLQQFFFLWTLKLASGYSVHLCCTITEQVKGGRTDIEICD